MLGSARDAAAGCTACDLWARATQTVFGEGPAHAPLFLLGEQPGDREDIEGHPFVGPAGELLGRALDDAGIRREDAFVSNVVKHFKWKPQGKRRLHERPNASEIRACRPWLDLELHLVRPDVLVLLGATAANAVLGPRFRLTEQRGTSSRRMAMAGPADRDVPPVRCPAGTGRRGATHDLRGPRRGPGGRSPAPRPDSGTRRRT